MYQSGLTAAEREFLIAQISKHATDQALISFAEQSLTDAQNMRSDMTALAKQANVNPLSLRKEAVKAQAADEKPQAQPPAPAVISEAALEGINVAPAGEAASRILSTTRADIVRRLQKSPATIAQLNQTINGRVANTQRLMRRLWDLKVVRFDGVFYHIL